MAPVSTVIKTKVAIIGAGPLGLELAISLKLAKVPYLQFDQGQAAQAIFNFPVGTRFFSSAERIGIAGIPIQTIDQQKCSREEYLAYIRSVIGQYQLSIKTYEKILSIQKTEEGEFLLKTETQNYLASIVIIATGGTSFPRKLNVPGENLPFVHWQMQDPHAYFNKKVLIVGGKNSAVEAALRCFHAKAKVSLATRKAQFADKEIKYWLLPELLSRIEKDEIHCFYDSHITEILPGEVTLLQKGIEIIEKTDFVVKAIGFDADLSLLKMAKVELQGEQNAPFYDLSTMETNISNLYVLGTIVGGTQKRYRVFIENTHHHIEKILLSISKKLQIDIHPFLNKLKITENLEE